MADKLKWSRTVPTTDGLYLVREVGDNIYQTEAVVVEQGYLKFYCFHCGSKVLPQYPEGLEFAGPLEVSKYA